MNETEAEPASGAESERAALRRCRSPSGSAQNKTRSTPGGCLGGDPGRPQRHPLATVPGTSAAPPPGPVQAQALPGRFIEVRVASGHTDSRTLRRMRAGPVGITNTIFARSGGDTTSSRGKLGKDRGASHGPKMVYIKWHLPLAFALTLSDRALHSKISALQFRKMPVSAFSATCQWART